MRNCVEIGAGIDPFIIRNHNPLSFIFDRWFLIDYDPHVINYLNKKVGHDPRVIGISGRGFKQEILDLAPESRNLVLMVDLIGDVHLPEWSGVGKNWQSSDFLSNLVMSSYRILKPLGNVIVVEARTPAPEDLVKEKFDSGGFQLVERSNKVSLYTSARSSEERYVLKFQKVCPPT